MEKQKQEFIYFKVKAKGQAWQHGEAQSQDLPELGTHHHIPPVLLWATAGFKLPL